MKLIVGLGNVGREYESTRHNLGFALVELLGITLGHRPSDFTKHSKAAADVLDLRATNGLMLVKPTTMMNLSGQAVGALANYYKVAPEDIWVIADEVDLPFGALRVSHGGGSAGHNGLKSIMSAVGPDFWRVRMGVRNQRFDVTPTDSFVLSRFDADEAAALPAMLKTAADMLETAVTRGELVTGDSNLAS